MLEFGGVFDVAAPPPRPACRVRRPCLDEEAAVPVAAAEREVEEEKAEEAEEDEDDEEAEA